MTSAEEPNAKRRKVNPCTETSTNTFDQVVIFQVVRFLNIIDLTRVNLVNKTWYHVSSNDSVWIPLLLHKRNATTNISATPNEHRAYQMFRTAPNWRHHFLNETLFEQFRQDPQVIYSSLHISKHVMQHLFDQMCKHRMQQLCQQDETVNHSELEQLTEGTIFGACRCKEIVSECDSIGTTTIDEYQVVSNFSFFNPGNFCLVSFECKVRVMSNQENSLKCHHIFDVVVTVQDFNSECDLEPLRVNLISLEGYSDEDDEDDELGDGIIARRYVNCDLLLKVNNEQAGHIATMLGISDVNTFLATVLECVEGRHSVVVVPSDYTLEQLIETEISESLAQLYTYVKAIHKRNELIHDLKEGKAFFYKQNTPSVWMKVQHTEEKRVARYCELMKLAENVTRIDEKGDEAGITISEYFSLSRTCTISIKSLSTSRIHKLVMNSCSYGNLDSNEDEGGSIDFHFDDVELWDDESTLFEESNRSYLKKEGLKLAMNLLGCQHITMLDFCDFIFACTGCATWFQRVVVDDDDVPKCFFNLDGLIIWSASALPQLNKYVNIK